MDETWKYFAKWEKSDTKVDILYDPISMKYLEQANTQRQRAGGQGLGVKWEQMA